LGCDSEALRRNRHLGTSWVLLGRAIAKLRTYLNTNET
jgi:hypothetical protein